MCKKRLGVIMSGPCATILTLPSIRSAFKHYPSMCEEAITRFKNTTSEESPARKEARAIVRFEKTAGLESRQEIKNRIDRKLSLYSFFLEESKGRNNLVCTERNLFVKMHVDFDSHV